MVSMVLFLSCILLATAASEPAVEVPSLESDDECLASGGGAQCVLSALQRRASVQRNVVDAAQNQTREDPCDSPLISQIKNMGPDCFAACPQICAPLQDAVIEFLEGEDPTDEVCKAKADFSCVIESANKATCDPLLDMAAGLGLTVPRTSASFEAACKGCPDACAGISLLGTDAEHLRRSTDDPCAGPIISQMKGFAVGCFEACPQVCAPLTATVLGYLQGEDQTSIVCAHKADFSCFISEANAKTCAPLLDKAEDLGLKVPRTQPDFTTACNGVGLLSEEAKQEAEDDPCDGPIIAQMKGFAVGCFEACPQVCAPLTTTVLNYMQGEDPTSLVCAAEADFSCFISEANAKTCAPLLDKAEGLGLKVPRTVSAFTDVCSHAEALLEASDTVEHKSGEDPMAADCDGPIIGQLKGIADSCFEACPQVCAPLTSTVLGYMQGKDPKLLVCDFKADFSCLVESANTETCAPLLDKAEGYGLDVPRTLPAFNSACAAADLLEVPDAQEHGSEDDPMTADCDGPIIGMLKGVADSCFEACPQVCAPLTSTVLGYMSGKDPKLLVCDFKADFSCLLEGANTETCAPLLDKAEGFGLAVPRTLTAFNAACA